MKLKILGSNSAVPAHGRHPSAQIVETEREDFLIDCGEGTQFQMLQYGVSKARIKNIFISHFHGDHYFGLVGLLTSMNLAQRAEKLTIFSPKGMREIMETHFLYSGTKLVFEVEYVVFDNQQSVKIYENKYLEVYTLPLHHKITTCGFLFREKPKKRHILKEKIEEYHIDIAQIVRIKDGADLVLSGGRTVPNAELTTDPSPALSYAYCSDTTYLESLIPLIEGVDLLYHEATFMESERERATFTLHSTTLDAAQIAQKAKVKRLLIGHYSSRYADILPLKTEAETVFRPVILAIEGEEIFIGNGQ